MMERYPRSILQKNSANKKEWKYRVKDVTIKSIGKQFPNS